MKLPPFALRLIIGCLFTLPVFAQEVQAPRPADIRLVIDVSGSMKQNDPNNLRQPAVDLLVQLLPDDSKSGIWTFGQYVNMLVPHRPVDRNWKAEASRRADEINSRGLFTNIGAALEKASYDADRLSPDLSPDYKTSIILLTDGMVDIDKNPQKNQAEWRRIVDDVLPGLRKAGYIVHTVALSENADTALLDKLAIETGGLSEVANDADQLMKLFLRVFDQAAPAQQVPLEGNRFHVDSSTEEFTALIFRNPDARPTRLISPDDTEYRYDLKDVDVNWYRTDAYDRITVKRPLEGEWLVVADMDPDSRVTIVSNLNLRLKPIPSNLFVGAESKLSLVIQEQNKTLTDPRFLSLLTINSLVQHRDSGSSWPALLSGDPPPANGVFHQDLDMFDEEGHYELTVQVDGRSFQRQVAHSLTVRRPFVVAIEPQVVDGHDQFLLSVRSHSQTIDSTDLQLVARVKTPDGSSAIKPLDLQANDEWHLSIRPEEEGVYEVQVRISGKDRNGVDVKFEPGTQRFRYPVSDSPFAEPELLPPPPVVEAPVAESPSPAPVGPEPEPLEEAAESSSLPLYIGLAVGNVLLVLLALLAYRLIMGKGNGNSVKALEEAADSIDAEEEVSPAPQAAAKPEPQAEPQMVAIEEDDLLEPEPQTAVDDEDLEQLAMDALEDDLDLGTEDFDSLDMGSATEPRPVPKAEQVDDFDSADLDELLDDNVAEDETAGKAKEKSPQEASEDDAGHDFSMDDFGPAAFDEDLDEKDKK